MQVSSCKFQRCSQPCTPAPGNSLSPRVHKPGTQIPHLLPNYIKRGGLSQQEVEEGWHTVTGRHLFCWYNRWRDHHNGHLNTFPMFHIQEGIAEAKNKSKTIQPGDWRENTSRPTGQIYALPLPVILIFPQINPLFVKHSHCSGVKEPILKRVVWTQAPWIITCQQGSNKQDPLRSTSPAHGPCAFN